MHPAPSNPNRPTTSPFRTARSRSATRFRPSASKTLSARSSNATSPRGRSARPSGASESPIISATTSWRVTAPTAWLPRMRPSRMTTMRSEIAKTSARRCETKMIATPRAFSSRMRSNNRSNSFSVSAAVGSSRMSSRARLASARAITTSCCVARSSAPIGMAGSRSRPKSASASRARRSRPATSIMPQRVGSSLRVRFSATLRSGTTLTSCGTSATPAASAAATPEGRKGRPAKVTSPS